MFKKLFPTCFFTLASFVGTTFAQDQPAPPATGETPATTETTENALDATKKTIESMGVEPPDVTTDDLLPLFYQGLSFLPYALGPLAVAMILYSGFSFIISRGDEEKVKKAKSAFMRSLLGAILLLVFMVLLMHYFPLEKVEEIKPY